MSDNLIKVPDEIPKDEVVLVLEIFKENETLVEIGELVFEIETSKTTYQINAPASGILYHKLKVGDELHSGSSLGEIKPNS